MYSILNTLFVAYRQKTYTVLLLFFIITLPTGYVLNSVSVILLGLFFFTDTLKNIQLKFFKLKSNKLYLVFILFFVVQVIGLIHTENMRYGLKLVKGFLPIIILPLTVLTEREIKFKRVLSFFKWYLFGLLLLLIAYQFFLYRTVLTFERQVFESLDISPFYYSAFIFIGIVITYFNLKKSKFKLGFDYVVIPFFIFCIILLSARICLVVLMLFFLIEFFKEFKSVSLIKKIVITIVLFFSLVGLAYQVPSLKNKINIAYKTVDFDFKTILTKNQITITRNSLEYRVLINHSSFNIIKENLLGVGTGDNRAALLEQYKKIEFRAGIKDNYNCHNQYMEEFTKTGFIGGIVFLIFIFIIIKSSIKNRRHLFYTCLLLALVCTTESYLNRQHGIMFAAFFISMFYRLEESEK